MRAFLFPGQGSQSVGMGAALAEASRAARDVFEQVDEALRQHLFRLMREGPEDELKLTENAQPAIMANSLAVFTALTKEGGSSWLRPRASSPDTAWANIRLCARRARSTFRPPPGF
jgi:[acyl-carrier-protein] S-malonyltransferase